MVFLRQSWITIRLMLQRRESVLTDFPAAETNRKKTG